MRPHRPARVASSCLALLSVAALAGAACGPGKLAEPLAKSPELKLKDQATCRAKLNVEKPLIVEWPSADRADLEAQQKSGLVVVRYEGCEMKVLSHCSAKGSYAYTAVTPKQDTVTIKNEDDLYAQVPAGAARLEAKLKSAGQLNVAMHLVGKFIADKHKIGLSDLAGDCEGATHAVVGFTVGAFEFFAGAQGEASASANVLGAGAGGASKAQRETLTKDGDPGACARATPKDDAPPGNCGALLRLEVVPLEKAPPATRATEPALAPAIVVGKIECPKGTNLKDGICQPEVSKKCPDGMAFVEGRGCVAILAPPPAQGKYRVVKIPDPTGTSPSRGPNNAPVTVQWFGGYQDPYTKKVAPTLKQLEREFPGQLRIVWRNVPLSFHKLSRTAATVALEARARGGASAFWSAHEKLIAIPVAEMDAPRVLAAGVGPALDATAISAAVNQEAHKAEIDNDLAIANLAGLSGTPSFVINGRVLLGAQPIEAFRELLVGELGLHPVNLAPPSAAPSRGSATAPLVLQVYGDYQSPFVRRVWPEVEQLEKELGTDVRVVWRAYPIGNLPNSQDAAQASFEALAQGKFWEMHKKLLAADRGLERSAILQYATEVGMNAAKLQDALDKRSHQAELQRDISDATQARIGGVPTLIFNDEILPGAQPIAVLREAARRNLGR